MLYKDPQTDNLWYLAITKHITLEIRIGFNKKIKCPKFTNFPVKKGPHRSIKGLAFIIIPFVLINLCLQDYTPSY